MTERYQDESVETSSLAVSDQVSVAMNEIAENMREGLRHHLEPVVGLDQKSVDPRS